MKKVLKNIEKPCRKRNKNNKENQLNKDKN